MYFDAAHHPPDRIRRHRTELGEHGEAGLHLGQRLLAQPVPVAANLEIDQGDVMAGVGERKRDASTHATRADGGDLHPSSNRKSSSREHAARPSDSSVRSPRRRSLPRIAPAMASRPSATGAGTLAQRATETKKARPSSTSSVM